uniref:trypsin I-P1-like isoform X1 n=3 Tax=Osmia lignaria TaxID=473952 RepID=UPI001478B98C|nr:trypsin I-P1-like isoform X1 [Osmia lignaria]
MLTYMHKLRYMKYTIYLYFSSVLSFCLCRIMFPFQLRASIELKPVYVLFTYLQKYIRSNRVKTYHTIEMLSKLIVFIAFLAVVSCEGKPYRGYPLPFYPKYTNEATEVPIKSVPWQASLQWGYTDHTHFCSGAIISERWILTSAHCALMVPPYGDFVVKVGKHNLQIKERTEQTVFVEKSIIQRNYDGEAGPYDIALLKLSKSLKYTDSVNSVDLPESGNVSNGAAVTLTGWGSSWRTYAPMMPDKLQLLKLNTIDIDTCNKSVIQLTGSSSLSVNSICTGPRSSGFATCNGDPGSPLVVSNGTNYELIGIASWGIVPCGTIGAPTIYTEVYPYIDWIINIMEYA